MHGFFLYDRMRKLIIGVCLLMLISSCGSGSKKMNPFEKLTEEIDSLSATKDTALIETVVEESMVPVTADESFADFIYNFALDQKMQLSRIVFPLPYSSDNKKEKIEMSNWTHDPLFSQLESYTVLFDKADDIELEKDTTMTSVKVEWIYLKSNKVKRYSFARKKGQWKLEAIDLIDRQTEAESKEDFYQFYEHFANDSIFQEERLQNPLKFVTVDPDDEFQILETTLEPGQWFAFQPMLPREFLTNVSYGQSENIKSNSKVIEIKGFGNGFNNTLYFERRNGQWKLVQFEDLSD